MFLPATECDFSRRERVPRLKSSWTPIARNPLGTQRPPLPSIAAVGPSY